MASAGYTDGGRLALQRFSAEGDLPTANAIAQRMTDGSFKLAISIRPPAGVASGRSLVLVAQPATSAIAPMAST